MSKTPPVTNSELTALRQTTIDQLCERFAEDLISVAEFERRVDKAHRVESIDALNMLLADLPAPSNLPVHTRNESATVPGPFTELAPRPAVANPADVRERDLMIGIWGGSGRRGRWTPARKCIAVATMGGVELDFRDAILPEHIEVTAIAVMGGIEIIVPPGVVVDTGGIAIMGGFEYQGDSAAQPPPDAPTISVKGMALMGGVNVTTRFSGETAREAKRRNKALLKARRQAASGRQLKSGDS